MPRAEPGSEAAVWSGDMRTTQRCEEESGNKKKKKTWDSWAPKCLTRPSLYLHTVKYTYTFYVFKTLIFKFSEFFWGFFVCFGKTQ